jgi:hypothetical protein
MSLHRLSAGTGYRYLLRHTCSGDVRRAADTPLTSYYTATGYPPGRWVGTGVAGLGGTAKVAGPVTEQAMEAVFGHGRDPITDQPLGRAYRHPRPLETRIDARVGRLGEMPELDRAAAVERIRSEEAARRPTAAVAGFDLTFTAPKSLSVLWAVADPDTQAVIAHAHRTAVDEVLGYLEQHALFTRAGTDGVLRLPTRGAVGAAFDHWDTRTGDPTTRSTLSPLRAISVLRICRRHKRRPHGPLPLGELIHHDVGSGMENPPSRAAGPPFVAVHS